MPLLLSAGYHVFVDLTDIAAARAHTVVAPALGPDPRLVGLLHRRLLAAGLRDGDRVVLASAGSSDGRGRVRLCRDGRGPLAELVGAPVTAAYLSAAEPRLADAVAAQRVQASAPRRRDAASTAVASSSRPTCSPPASSPTSPPRAAQTSSPPPLLLPDEPPAQELVDIVVERYLG